jgi:hypothetical protein
MRNVMCARPQGVLDRRRQATCKVQQAEKAAQQLWNTDNIQADAVAPADAGPGLSPLAQATGKDNTSMPCGMKVLGSGVWVCCLAQQHSQEGARLRHTRL